MASKRKNEERADVTEMGMEDVDWIRYFQKRCMNHISEKIFRHLDYQSLSSAAAASPLWNQIILNSNIWHKLYKKNMREEFGWRRVCSAIEISTPWCTINENKHSNPQSYYQEVCQKTSEWIIKLEKKWSFGRARTGYLKWPLPSERFQKNPSFEINEQWIVQGQPSGCIEIRERWSNQVHHVLDFELDGSEYDYRHAEFREVECIQFNNQIIAAGFVFGEVCVWSMESKKLLNIFQDFSLVSEQIPEDSSLAAEFIRLSEAGYQRSVLVTCLISCEEEYNLLTLREIKGIDEISLSAYVLLESGRTVKDIVVDESRVLVASVVDVEDGDEALSYEIQIRNLTNLALLNCIVSPCTPEFHDPQMHYLNGNLVTAVNHKLSFWDTLSGNCLKMIPVGEYASSLRSIRFISDRFVVSCHTDGQLNVWDVKAALDSSCLPDMVFLRSFQLKLSENHRSRYMMIRGDELQVFVEVQIGLYIRSDTLDCVKKASFVLDFVEEESDSEEDSSENEE